MQCGGTRQRRRDGSMFFGDARLRPPFVCRIAEMPLFVRDLYVAVDVVRAPLRMKLRRGPCTLADAMSSRTV